jgi:hypothetical protein
MSLIAIPTLTDGSPAYRQRVRLDGQDWLLDFVFNGRSGFWALTLLNLDGEALLTGQAVVCGLPLLRRCLTGGPPGQLWAVPLDETFEPPGLTELGARVMLVYISEDDELLS